MNCPKRVCGVCSSSRGARRPRQPEVDDPRHRLAVHLDDQDVRRLQIAMDDRLLVRMLNAIARQDEQLDARANPQLVGVAILGDRQPRNVLHDEIRLSLRRGTGIEDLGDRGMIHHRQRLALRLEALRDALIVHAGADQLQATRRRTGAVCSASQT